MDFLSRVRCAVLVLAIGLQRFASVADVVIVDFEPAHVVITTANMRWETAAGTDRFEVFRVRDLHDLVALVVLPVVFA